MYSHVHMYTHVYTHVHTYPSHVCTHVHMCPCQGEHLCAYAHISLPLLSLTQAGGSISHTVSSQIPRHHSWVLSSPLSPSHSLTTVGQCLNISQSHLLPVLPHPDSSQRAVPPPPTLHTVATRITFPSHKFDLTRAPLKTLPGSLTKQDAKLLSFT